MGDEKYAGGDAWASAFDSRQSPTREDAARYLIAHRAVIRSRITNKFRRACRGMPGWDPEDVESSVLRRVDLALLRGVLRPCSEREFWAYVLAIVDNVILGRLRSGAYSRRAAEGAAHEAHRVTSAFRGCRDDDEAAQRLHEMFMALPNDGDRELLLWRLEGAPHAAVAVATGRNEPAIRRQWARICRRLRSQFH